MCSQVLPKGNWSLKLMLNVSINDKLILLNVSSTDVKKSLATI